ncbi:MAG: two-component sensor histidine kinase, partial [Anaerolineae bacterium]|nr:two-component sensor histidine kinase [Anaerolineae bacterium]
LNELALNDISLIYNSAQHLLALINDILDISKIEAGMMELVPEPVALDEIMREVLAAAHSLLKNKPVEVLTEISAELPPVYADKLRLRQILLNLASNAAKFTKEGQITIGAEIYPANPHQMHIWVQDTGIGIPNEKLEAIFDRFSQADNSITRQYGGTGLGLPICKQLVELHGGTIGVSSHVGAGSKFYFTIPLNDVSAVG